MLIDHDARLQALDPTQSFIVQAPAGSGKTELLTQRFLRLLSCVEQPEQLVALTFTRKAANEMRARISDALQSAANGANPDAAHKQTTAKWAKAALARSDQLDWQLLNMPSRLRITTIDALCQMLARAIPLYEQHTPYAEINSSPEELYFSAASACFQYLLDTPALKETLTCLLEHLDNRTDRLMSLFIEQLRSRDQWLRIIQTAKLQDKSHYEQALATIIRHEINCFKATIPSDCRLKLLSLSQQVAALNPAKYAPLEHWMSWDELQAPHTRALATLLLTSQGSLRKAFDHHVGVTRATPLLKQESKALLTQLASTDDFIAALRRVKHLPQAQYEPQQWQVLQAVLTVLPLLAAHLQLLFNQRNQVDFTAVALQAGQALGDSDAPTDLALYLDHSITFAPMKHSLLGLISNSKPFSLPEMI